MASASTASADSEPAQLTALQHGINHEQVQALIDDPALSDEALYEQAQKHVSILKRPEFRSHNVPAWVSRLKNHPDVSFFGEYTTEKVFRAMWTAADALKLHAGKRYVSAAACVCASGAVKADEAAGGSESSRDAAVDERVARALEGLATTWVAYLLWPFRSMPSERTTDDYWEFAPTPDEDETEPTPSAVVAGLRRDRPISRRDLEDMVERRDNCTCVLTGAHNDHTPKALFLFPAAESSLAAPLEVAHIFKRSVVVIEPDDGENVRASKMATFDILKHYCELEGDIEQLTLSVDEPQNALLLEKNAHASFDCLKWCLCPTENPNEYEIRQMPMCAGVEPLQTGHVTFVDHSPHVDVPGRTGKRLHDTLGVDVPSPQLLRLHAALAHVMHLIDAETILGTTEPDDWFESPVRIANYGADFIEMVVDNGMDEFPRSIARLPVVPERETWRPVYHILDID
ncbi:hypothetical protein C2E23DRAFT_890637 [Lenzites betulinus]|nr:hypothetical protein C2E23DRAFT_890637 [Lenzites betulinus]